MLNPFNWGFVALQVIATVATEPLLLIVATVFVTLLLAAALFF